MDDQRIAFWTTRLAAMSLPARGKTRFGRRALLRSSLLIALVAGTLLSAAMPNTTSAKKAEFTYFAEAFNFISSDAAGVETIVQVQAIDRPTEPDEVSLAVTRSDPACAAPDSGCPYVLLSGSVSGVPVAEGDVRIQPNLRWARVATSITFVDTISGTSCAATVDLTWRATSQIFPEGDFPQGDRVSGFRKADAAGTITCGDEEFLGGQVDPGAEISRFIRSG